MDYVVLLAGAWVSGAYAAWPRARYEQSANDMTVLLSSDGPKATRGPCQRTERTDYDVAALPRGRKPQRSILGGGRAGPCLEPRATS